MTKHGFAKSFECQCLKLQAMKILMSPSQLTASNAVGETTCFSGTFQDVALDFKNLRGFLHCRPSLWLLQGTLLRLPMKNLNELDAEQNKESKNCPVSSGSSEASMASMRHWQTISSPQPWRKVYARRK